MDGIRWLLVAIGGIIGGVVSLFFCPGRLFYVLFFVLGPTVIPRHLWIQLYSDADKVGMFGTFIFGVGVGSLIVGGLFGELLRVFVVTAGFCLGASLGVLLALLTIENPGGLAGMIQFVGMIGYGILGGFIGLLFGCILSRRLPEKLRESPPKSPTPE